jgi:hypothetical protein
VTSRSDVLLLYAARSLRGLGDGFAVVILPAYLTAIAFGPVEIGFVATASLFGTAILTLLVGLVAPRYDLRNMLLLEHVLDPGSILVEPGGGLGAAAGARRVVADGRTDTDILRDGGGDVARAHRGRERHRGAA